MALTPTQKKNLRAKISLFCRRAEAREVVWSYTQQRPFTGIGKDPERSHDNDCSGYVSLVFNWAMHEAQVFAADPLGYRYSGYGYTGTQLEWLRSHGSPAPVDKYLVGDMAIWGHSASNTTHTAICSVRGTASSAWWSSHGNEGGPERVKLGYHPHRLIGVWRHPALL